MFDFVQKNSIFIKVVLGAVALTFVGFGVGSYTAATSDPYLANVDGVKIYPQDVDRFLEGRPADAAMRQAALDQLIQQQLLLAQARKSGLVITSPELQQAIAAVPAFQENGAFSKARYQAFLKQQSIQATDFEQKIRQDLLIQKQLNFVASSAFISRTSVSQLAHLLSETRNIQPYVLRPDNILKDIKVTEDEARKAYDAKKSAYLTPEAVKLSYLKISQDALAKSIKVADAEVGRYYEEHKSELGGEERKVAHILIATPANADAATQDKAKAEIESIAAELKANPARFAEIAKNRSQDPGSAVQGGSLGFFSRGVMVKAFDDAAFALEEGQLSSVVKTEFGYHILRVDAIRRPNLAALKPMIVERIQKQKANAAYRKLVEEAGELAYQQSDSLVAVGEKFNLAVHESDWLNRGDGETPSELSHPRVQEAAFSDDVLKQKHNSEAIDLGNGKTLIIRVSEHRPARQQPFEEVRARIEAELVRKKAVKQIAEQGKAMLLALKAGKAHPAWGPSQTVSREAPIGLPPELARLVFGVSPKAVPGYVGAALPSGDFLMYRVDGVTQAKVDPQRNAAIAARATELHANAQALALVGSARAHTQVEIVPQQKAAE